MKKSFILSFVVLGFFSISAYAQPGNKKVDTVKPAKELILKNAGEKDLPQQLKQNQLTEQPVVLKSDSSYKGSKAKGRHCKHYKHKHSK